MSPRQMFLIATHATSADLMLPTRRRHEHQVLTRCRCPSSCSQSQSPLPNVFHSNEAGDARCHMWRVTTSQQNYRVESMNRESEFFSFRDERLTCHFDEQRQVHRCPSARCSVNAAASAHTALRTHLPAAMRDDDCTNVSDVSDDCSYDDDDRDHRRRWLCHSQTTHCWTTICIKQAVSAITRKRTVNCLSCAPTPATITRTRMSLLHAHTQTGTLTGSSAPTPPT
jgi:hypothetical protein